MSARKGRKRRPRRRFWQLGVKLAYVGLVYVSANVLINAAIVWTRPFDPTSLVAMRHFEDRVLATYFLVKHLAWHDAFLEERDIPRLVGEVASTSGLDPVLLQALVDVESSGRPHVVSPAGACGLTQLMPRTALELGVQDPFDPRENLRAGATYLQRMMARFDGRLSLALAAYNAGPGAIEAFGGVPPFGETRVYVDRISRRYAELSGRGGEP